MTLNETKFGRGLTLDDLIVELRPLIRQKISGENTNPSRPEDIAEILAQLLAYVCAVETLLQSASPRPWSAIPGLTVPVRSLVEQLLSGDGLEGAKKRLTDYFKAAIGNFADTHTNVEKKLDRFSEQLVEGLGPSVIKARAQVSAIQKLFGMQEIAYWRAFCKQFSLIDPAAVRDLASSVERERSRGNE